MVLFRIYGIVSYREGKLQIQWKEPNLIPVPKQKPVKGINNYLRPISLTPILSKIAKEYVVDSYVKPSVLKNIDPQQYGTVPDSRTTFALINMIHSWLKSTNGNDSSARVMLFVFLKAFDFDHNVLLCKLSSYGFPTSIML